MPRRLLRDGRVTVDDWSYFSAGGGQGAAGGTIITLEQWLADKPRWLKEPSRLGVVILPANDVDTLVPDLGRLELIAAEFPGPSDGRGYSQGRLLRERHGFKGELRAAGYVRRDQLFFLARCGFNSFELADADIDQVGNAFHTFSAEYQPANDAGLEYKPHAR